MKASIVIATYNSREYLKKALLSIAQQTFNHSDFEVIVVDDFSEDDTGQMVEEFSKAVDFKIRYFKNDKKGEVNARNKGFEEAKGEIVISADSDLEASPDWLKNGIAYFDDKAVFAAEGRIVASGKTKPFYHTLSSEEGGFYQTANMFYRRDILQKVGFLDEELNRWWAHGADYDLALRIMAAGGRIPYAKDAVLYHALYKSKIKKILRDALRPAVIPYHYKKHGNKIPHHIKMDVFNAVSGAFSSLALFLFAASKYFSAIVCLVFAAAAARRRIHGFGPAALLTKIKALALYIAVSAINLWAFIYGCFYYKVFPRKGIFRL